MKRTGQGSFFVAWKNCWIAFCIKILSNMNMRIYCFMSNYTNQAGYVELRDGWKNAWRTTLERVWKKQSRNLHAPLCGIFQPNSVAVAYYDALIRAKSPTNCDTHLAESFFKQALRFICASGSTGGGGIVSSKNNVWESTWKSIPEIYVPNFTVYFAECLFKHALVRWHFKRYEICN